MRANERQVGGTHYQSEVQHWDYVVANNIPYLEATIIKYLTRWRKKNGLEDLEKAKHYFDKLMEVEIARTGSVVTLPAPRKAGLSDPSTCPDCGALRSAEHTCGRDYGGH